MTIGLYFVQRLTAAIMLPMVIIHLVAIYLATAQELNAADILSRTRGSLGWAAFYGLFVAAAVIHGTIGLYNVAREWTSLAARTVLLSCLGLGAGLLALGLRAVAAVVAP